MPREIDPKHIEKQRREDRYREIATTLARGKRTPADAAGAVLELLGDLRRFFVDWVQRLTSEIQSTSDWKPMPDANMVPMLEFGNRYLVWKASREDACSLRGYILLRWPNLWNPIARVWLAFDAAMYSPDGDLTTFLEARPNQEQLESLSAKAFMLGEWINRFEAVIKRYGLETTDYDSRVAESERVQTVDAEATADGEAQLPIPAAKLEQLVEAIGDENTGRILAVAKRKDWAADRKMEEILRIDGRFAGKDSQTWAKLLEVSDAAIRKTTTWKLIRNQAAE